jgi:hypothetical protein
MDNHEENNELNPLEKQLQEINEWQRNANNPGYYIGTGRVPTGFKNVMRSPILLLIVGILLLLISVYGLISNFSIQTISSGAVGFVLGIGLTIGGIIRLVKRD